MNINWNQIIDILSSSTKVSGAFFVTSAVLCIGFKYENALIPKVPDSIYVYVFSVFIFSTSVLAFTLAAKIQRGVFSVTEKIKKNKRIKLALTERTNLSEIEVFILVSFVPLGNDFNDVMDISYQTEKFTKLELSAAVDKLENKGLLDVQYNRDHFKITAIGREVALEYLEEYRERT